MLQPPVLYIKLHGKSSTLGTFKTKKKKERKLESGSEKSKGGIKRKKKTVTIQFHKVFFFRKKMFLFFLDFRALHIPANFKIFTISSSWKKEKN